VRKLGDFTISPPQVEVQNPAFDVTPAKYITGIVTEKGVAKPPFERSLAAFEE
jgi:methylthioribose-1-phosphate isomerase